MQTWFILAAIVAPLCFALVNISDSYLVKHVAPIRALFLFSGLFTFVVAFVFLIISMTGGIEIFLPTKTVLILLLSGVLEFSWLWFYLKALENEDVPVSSVIPFFQLIGVFVYILGIIFLGEKLAVSNLFYAFLVLLGGAMLAIDFKEFTFRFREAFLMSISALIIALGSVFFKTQAMDDLSLFPTSMFWMSLGMGITALVCYIALPTFRKELHDTMSENQKSKTTIAINISNEVLNAIGLVAVMFASLKIQIAQVYAVGLLQYFYVFLIGLVGTLVAPHIFNEKISRSSLIPKIIAIALMIIGGAMLEMRS